MKTLDGGGLIRDVFSGIVRPEFESRALLIAFHAGRRHSLLGKLSLMKILFLKLAAWLIPRGEKMQLANEAAPNNRSAEHWKRKAAMAIGRPELADGSDDDLEAAHDAHMQAAYEMANAPDVELPNSATYGEGNNQPMPPGPASATEKFQKLQQLIASLVQEAMETQKISYEAAYQHVRIVYPQYFPETYRPGSAQQISNDSSRREEFYALVNARIGDGMDRTEAFVSVQRENPDLLP